MRVLFQKAHAEADAEESAGLPLEALHCVKEANWISPDLCNAEWTITTWAYPLQGLDMLPFNLQVNDSSHCIVKKMQSRPIASASAVQPAPPEQTCLHQLLSHLTNLQLENREVVNSADCSYVLSLAL